MTKQIGYFVEENRPADIGTAVAILKGIAKALAGLHLQNRVWDFKESSILVQSDNSVEVVGYVPPNSEPIEDSARDPMDIISLDVMPPEFLKDRRHDVRGDIYGVGVIGFELLSGRAPFSGKSVVESMKARLDHNVELLHTIREDVPEPLSRIVAKAMATNPEHRYQRMEDLFAELDALAL